ncbi:hypothetical protein [Nocardia farcinica]|uniref:Uncharacterized protein n=1 Tax=Nocardia farcinica (strain IFM 10152) TaxID=247156 RepID=Q5YSF2_NOCFA|nr:hypothetical protein [Nocardia farcinica]BAD58889.1 hypothetical protein NFA_40410 [Nocardia farcinica IFM 10152]
MTSLSASTLISKRYRWRKANGIAVYRPAGPVCDHIWALYTLDVTAPMIGAAAGCTEQAIHAIANGVARQVRVQLAERILAVTHAPHPRQKLVLAVGAARRIRALNAIGWPTADLAARLGLNDASNLNQSINRLHITYPRWAAIRDLYEELSGTPGPKPDTARRFRTKPAPPLAWEGRDIDDPRAQPDWKAMGIKLSERPVCPNGHRYRDGNLAYDSRGHRQCRQCARDANAKARAQRRHAGTRTSPEGARS